jgi:hypothetical protein
MTKKKIEDTKKSVDRCKNITQEIIDVLNEYQTNDVEVDYMLSLLLTSVMLSRGLDQKQSNELIDLICDTAKLRIEDIVLTKIDVKKLAEKITAKNKYKTLKTGKIVGKAKI